MPKHGRAICLTTFILLVFVRESGRGEEGKRERGGEKKRKREEERTAFVYTESVLFHQGSEMANSFLRVYQGNWMQNQPRPQK